MIQRIQSLFFLVIIISMLLLIFFPYWKTMTDDNTRWTLTAFQLIQSHEKEITTNPAWYTGLGAIATMFLSTITLFMYHNRPRQMLLSTIISLCIFGTAVSMIYFVKLAQPLSGSTDISNYTWVIGTIILSFVSNVLAKFFIKKDDNLVKNVDRLR